MIVDTLESHDTWAWSDYNQVLENCGLGYYDFRIETRAIDENGDEMPLNEQNEVWLDCLIPDMLMYWLDNRAYQELFDIVMFYDASSSSKSTSYFDLGYPKDEIKVDENGNIENEEQIKRDMLAWATGSGRSR